MDFDPRVTSDGTDFGWEHGWDCNFHIGYGHDIIDEEAQNAKSCALALRHLIAAADDEILNLEDELAILRCQLMWSEFDHRRDLIETLCAAFKHKTGSLILAIQSLKSGNASSGQDNDVALEFRKPPERIAEIIDAVINCRAPDLNEQATTKEEGIPSEGLQDRETQKSVDEPKNFRSDSSIDLSAIINLEEEHPVIDYQMVNERSSEATFTADVLLTKSQSSLSSVLNSDGHKAQEKLQSNVVCAKETSLPFEPYVEIVDSDSPSKADSFEHSGSPSSVVPGISFMFPKEIEPNIFVASASQNSSTKRQDQQATSRSSAHSRNKRRYLDTLLVAGIDSESSWKKATPHILEDQSEYDLGNLRRQFNKDHTFLTGWKGDKLRAALKAHKIKYINNMLKQEMIDILTKLINK